MNKLKQYLENMEKFVIHNIRLDHINEETTVGELLNFIESVKEKYIPICEKINNFKKSNN